MPLSRQFEHAKLLNWRECRCLHCSATFPTYRQLNQHVAQGHQVSLFFCWICTQGFRRSRQLNDHLLSQHLVHFDCPNCDQLFKSWPDLKGHHCRGHRRTTAALACRDGSKPNNDGMKKTLKEHKLDGAFVCGQADCGRSFKIASSLRQHLVIQHDVQEVSNAQLKSFFKEVLNCPYCQESVAGWKALQSHRCRHSEVVSKLDNKREADLSDVAATPIAKIQSSTCNKGLAGPQVPTAGLLGHEADRSHEGGVGCPHCNRTFANHRQMLKHRASSH